MFAIYFACKDFAEGLHRSIKSNEKVSRRLFVRSF